MITQTIDEAQAARLDLETACDHLDSAAWIAAGASEYLDGARRTRATEIVDRLRGALADLDRLREAL